MFSGLILIGRGLNQLDKDNKQQFDYYLVLSDLKKTQQSGNDGMMDTPVPIPNTEVKHHNGDDSAMCDNSKLPV